MKKTLLLGAALAVGVAGFAQNTAKKVNPAYFKKMSVIENNKISVESPTTPTKGITVNTAKNGHLSTSSTCTTIAVSSSWNCNGVGGGLNTTQQNCLSYNQDLNSLVWTQRGSKQWSLNTTSGFMQATIINATTLVKDSVILYDDATTHHARYPSGVLLNPTTNTSNSYTNAIAVAYGVVTDNTNWTGTAYTAKPLWSKSALTHTVPSGDSLYTPAAGGLFGNDVHALAYEGAPSIDVQALSDGKTVVSIGTIGDQTMTCTNCNPVYKGIFVKAVLNGAGNAVTWTTDSTSLVPPVKKGTLGYHLTAPRMAFGPDGLHGYAVFLGVLNTTYGIPCVDSAMTPILYTTTDGGVTWTQKLAGYDWMCHHPEVEKNVGELTGNKRFYTFNESFQGADVTVDANNVLHFVTCVNQSSSLPNSSGVTTIDSLGIYTPIYNYDYVNYHPIIWDFMTDGTTWKTMMVDSIITSPCGNAAASDTTTSHSGMGGSTPLNVTSHITVSRSKDGSKIFYGWADSNFGITGSKYNDTPDLLVKGYDVTSGKTTATINATNLGSCFYPYLSDISYQDPISNNWVVPAVFTTGHVVLAVTPQTTYDATQQADYFYANCGTFNPTTDFTTVPVITNGVPTATCAPNPYQVGIEQHNNAFAASISNYPNPFNNTTTIAVTLTENKNVDVKVYNTIGTLVFSKKVNGNVGENNVTFDGSSLSSGVYYYTVTAGNQQATKKMIIQK